MNPNPYTLKDADFFQARAYVARKLANHPFWLDNLEAENAWRQAQRDLVTLTRWCNDWLTPEQWRQMQSAIRDPRRPQTPPRPVGIPPAQRTRHFVSSGLVDFVRLGQA